MPDFVLRKWELTPYPGDQAPRHVHHRSDEAFCVLRGQLDVLVGESRRLLGAGEFAFIPAGTTHTFATVGQQGAVVLAVMTEEIDALVEALHRGAGGEDPADLWARYHSSVVG